VKHFADRLLEAIRRKGSPVCVGLDPLLERLPADLAPGGDPARAGDDPAAAAALLERFCREVIDAVADIVPAVKPQVAHFERYGGAGMSAYHQVIRTARQAGLIVIADVKRGDIGSTAEQYAAAYLNRPDGPDALTVNGYFGADGLRPFVEAARAGGNGLFVLVRTSNPSAGDVQDFTDPAGKTLFQHAAECVARLGEAGELIGARGYSLVGAVVAATYPQEARLLREIMPQQLFLVPGYGAQGAGAEDCAAAFKPDGTGAIVNASRSVIYAFRRPGQVEADWKAAVREAARAFAGDIARALGGT